MDDVFRFLIGHGHTVLFPWVAVILRGRGIQRVRPPAGGLEGWRTLGFPLETKLPT